MFWHRETHGRVDLGFTDRLGGRSVGPFDSLNLGTSSGDDRATVRGNLGLVADALGVEGLHVMSQVHGDDVVVASTLHEEGSGTVPVCDALVTTRPGLALMVRVADCVPIVLADEEAGVGGVVHAGRVGLVAGVVPATVRSMHEQGASRLRAWVGPRACGSCYELPEAMVADVEAAVPGTRSVTSWGTPASDVGAGVVAQLADLGVDVDDVGRDVCTIEDDRFYSYRRQGAASGRFGAAVVLR